MSLLKEKIFPELKSYLCLDLWASLDVKNRVIFLCVYLVTILSCGFFFYYGQFHYLEWILTLKNPLLWYLISVISFVAIVGMLAWFFDLAKILRVQKIYERPSFVYFLRVAIILGLMSSILFKLLHGVLLPGSYYPAYALYFLDAVCVAVISFTLHFFYKLYLKPAGFPELVHAYGAVGKSEDLYGLASIGERLSHIIENLGRNVSVLCVTAPMGAGKSSLIRMALESLDNSTFLYTYVSLTESNAENDFSKLFMSRWLDTLSGRYPVMKLAHAAFGLEEVLRESNGDWLHTTVRFLFSRNKAFFRSKTRTFGEFYSGDNKYVDTEVNKIFGGVDAFKEGLWIVVIDEIERAKPGEIYRVIEIIERFKNIGNSGMPVKVVFILPISWQELSERAKAECCDMLDVAHGFFSNGSKSVTDFFHVPVPDSDTLRAGLLDQLRTLFDKPYKETLDRMNDVRYVHLNESSFNDDSADRLEVVLDLLSGKSLRFINRVFDSAFYKTEAFSRLNYYPLAGHLPLSDLLALELISLKYPRFYDFMYEKLDYFSGSISSYFRKDEVKKKYKSFVNWFEVESGVELDLYQREELLKLLQLCAFHYVEIFNNNDRYSGRMEPRSGTTSHPDYLRDYFTLQSGQNLDGKRRLYRIYLEHSDKKLTMIDSLEDKDFKDYIYFLRHMQVTNPELFYDLMSRWKSRFAHIKNRSVEPYPRDLSFDDIYDGFVYAYEVLILCLLELTKADVLSRVYAFFHEFVVDESNKFESRFIFLSGFVNRRRGSGIHSELTNAFAKLRVGFASDVDRDIEVLFNQLRSMIGSGRNLLLEEKNFFYVLYQSWSGRKDSGAELENMSKHVRKWLKEKPILVNHFWDQLPIEEKQWSNEFEIRQALHDRHPFTYLGIQELIAITRSNKGHLTQDNFQKFSFWYMLDDKLLMSVDEIRKEDASTLMSELLAQNLVETPFWLTLDVAA